MAGDHGWHVFDAEQGLEVQVTGGQIQVRRTGDYRPPVILTDEQWEQVREPGPDPDIMAQLDPEYDPWANPDDGIG